MTKPGESCDDSESEVSSEDVLGLLGTMGGESNKRRLNVSDTLVDKSNSKSLLSITGVDGASGEWACPLVTC